MFKLCGESTQKWSAERRFCGFGVAWLTVVAVVGCTAETGAQPENTSAGASVSATPSSPSTAGSATPEGATPTGSRESSSSNKTATAEPSSVPTPVPATQVPWTGSGKFTSVTPATATPRSGATVRRLAFRVEDGIDVDPTEFVEFVLATVNDSRSWAHDGYHFVGVTEKPHNVVTLASPETSARLCRPLKTFGKLSCRVGNRVVFTNYRWAQGHQDYGTDLLGYRRYLVNHEIGHSIGHDRHLPCPGKGKVAPVMMQQTKGLKGCLPNSWPYPQG